MNILKERYKQDINVKPVVISDIVDVSIEEICAAKADYAMFLRREGLGFSLINDRLMFKNTSTDELKNILKRLKNEYGFKDWQIITQPSDNIIERLYDSFKKDIKNDEILGLLVPVIKKNREIIVNVMRQEGYYHIGGIPVNVTQKHNAKWTSLWFAPNEQQDVHSF